MALGDMEVKKVTYRLGRRGWLLTTEAGDKILAMEFLLFNLINQHFLKVYCMCLPSTEDRGAIALVFMKLGG